MSLNLGRYEFNVMSGNELSGAFTDVVLKLKRSETTPERHIFFNIHPSQDIYWNGIASTINQQFAPFFNSFCDLRKKYILKGADELRRFDANAVFNLISICDFKYQNDSHSSLSYRDVDRDEIVKLRDITSDHILSFLGFTKGRHLQFESSPSKLIEEIYFPSHNGIYEQVMLETHHKTVTEMLQLFCANS